ncbi:MAG: DUF1343 domain-containing protein [bacterium]|nr:DUF1343 domain-containing protein [bacterium]
MKRTSVLYFGIFFILSGHINIISYKLGIENISDAIIERFGNNKKRIGLITNQTGIDQSGQRSVDILLKKGFNITYLFGPEHGIDSTKGSFEDVQDSVDTRTKIPVVSLHKNGTGTLVPKEVLQKIDVLMFDIQDSGMRHFTYISTLLQVMKMAAAYDKYVVIFDRPNPLGVLMEGPVTQKNLKSFISIAEIPLRHGMTIGELARYFNAYELEKPINKLYIVKMARYDRRVGLNNRLLVPISPGLRTIQSCLGYSFLGLLGEIGPFGIGLRTDFRYQCIVLPKKLKVPNRVWVQLYNKLKAYGINSVPHEYNDPKSNLPFRGLRLQIKDINQVRGFGALHMILSHFKAHGVTLSFSKYFDYAIGTSSVRKIFNEDERHTSLNGQLNAELSVFFQKAHKFFLYNPLPVPVLLD